MSALKIGATIKIPDIGPEAKVIDFRSTDVLMEIDGDRIWIPIDFLRLILEGGE